MTRVSTLLSAAVAQADPIAKSNCPPDTVHPLVSQSYVRISVTEEWYPNTVSTRAETHVSQTPTYPVHQLPKLNIRLQ